MAVCLALRLAARPPVTPPHDDAVAYVAATGHLGEYGRIFGRSTEPFGAWTTAADWQRLWSIEDPFCFRRISSGLARYEMHPPLYYWLLHVWLVLFGVSASAGAWFNLPLAAITVLLLYGLGFYTTRSRAASAVAVLLWGASPAVLGITLIARQYELLALLSVALVWSTLRSSDAERTPSGRQLTLLALIAALGLLTHYHFAVVLAAATLVAAWRLRAAPTRRLRALVAAAGAGVVFALAAHPYFDSAMRLSRQAGGTFQWTDVPRRSRWILAQLPGFGGGDRVAEAVWVLALASAGVVAVALARRAARERSRALALEPIVSLAGIALLVWTAIAVLFLSTVSPVHAMGRRYLSPLWPLLALVVTALLWRSRAGRVLAAALCAAILVAGWKWRQSLDDGAHSIVTVGAGESLLLDTAERGILPPTLWHVPPSTAVFAASQAHLLEHRNEWLPALGERAVYIATIAFRNTDEGRDRVLALLRTRYDVVPEPVVGRQRWPRQERYRLRPSAATANATVATVVSHHTASVPPSFSTSTNPSVN